MSSHNHLRVLLIGGTGLGQDQVAGALAGLPVEVETMLSLADLRERVHPALPDAAILDLCEPDQERCFAAIEEAQDLLPGVPLVAIGDATDERVALRAVQAGAQDYLLRPRITGEILLRVLRYAVERGRSEEIQRFLSQASAALVASLDYEATLQQVARLAVPVLADHCIVDVMDEDDDERAVAVAHVDPAKEQQLRDLVVTARPRRGTRRYGMPDVRTMPPQLFPQVTDDLLEKVAPDPVHRARLRAQGIQSVIVVPLVARERTLGMLMLVSAESGRRYGPADLALAEDLAQRAALAVDNARLYHEAQEAVRLRDEVLAFVSHDLRGPLAAVKLHVSLLQDEQTRTRVFATPESNAARRLGRITSLISKMTRLIDDLMDIGNLQRAQDLDLNEVPADLDALVRAAIAEHQHATDEHTLRLDTDGSDLVGLWDVGRIERVLDNLLSNAIKYSPEGGNVLISLRRLREADRDWAVLEIRDHGVGVPIDEQDQIFQRFFRGRNVAGRIAGTGIGLAGVKKIVEQHGGTITFTSAGQGQGSTFTVRLPLPAERPQLPPSPPSSDLARPVAPALIGARRRRATASA